MRLYSAYINRQAARDASSVFEPERVVKKIESEGERLYELAKQEKKDSVELETAERDAKVSDIAREQREELADIEDVATEAFRIIRESVLLIHTQLDELKGLVKDNEVLKQSGFPIEIADQLEDMLKQEIKSILTHLREMQADIDETAGSG